MVGGGLPLIYYHLLYLRPRARKGLSQTAIDSVYYFGFLITIAALGMSAVTLAWSSGTEPLANIAFQFGLGLLATGYAVLARMHLTSISAFVEEASPEAVLDRYVQRSRELVTNVEIASTQFAELSTNLMAKSEQVAETARLTTEKAMLDVARAFDQELRSTLASARQGLAEIRGLVNETSFVQEREALGKSVRETLDCVLSLNKALSEFSSRSVEGARTSEQVSEASVALKETLNEFQQNLDRIGGDNGQLIISARALAVAQSTVVEGAHSLSAAVEQLGEVSGSVSGINLTFRHIKTLTTKANEQLEALVQTSERLDGAARNLERSAGTTDKLADSVERVVRSMPALAEGADTLDKGLGGLSLALSAIENDLRSFSRPTQEVVELSLQLKEALETVHRVLQSSKSEAAQMAHHSINHAAALERATTLAKQVENVQDAGASINAVLAKLNDTIEKVHTSVGSSASNLNAALSTATQSLEHDVKRSSDAARMFGERLTNVAQIIIDRTQGPRPL